MPIFPQKHGSSKAMFRADSTEMHCTMIGNSTKGRWENGEEFQYAYAVINILENFSHNEMHHCICWRTVTASTHSKA